MANKVVFEVVATSKGFEVVQRQQKKLQKDIEGTAGSHKKLNKVKKKSKKQRKTKFVKKKKKEKFIKLKKANYQPQIKKKQKVQSKLGLMIKLIFLM